MLKINTYSEDSLCKQLCLDFVYSSERPKFIFGRNEFAASIASLVDIVGFIDDFTNESSFLGKPIVLIDHIPANAIVVSVVIGKPLRAEKRLKQFQFDVIDYFTFYKLSGLEQKLQPIAYWTGFDHDFGINKSRYEAIYNRLADTVSQNQFYNLINFRLSCNLDFMRGFSAREDEQYFEEFLHLQPDETFVDVGGFDGYTSLEFIRHCPQYRKIHFFEPEEEIAQEAKKRLSAYSNVVFHNIGLSNNKQTFRFTKSGSASRISEEGQSIIHVDRLDNVLSEKVSFVKMDIEGAERMAIEGARDTIMKWHPKLAICVYHRADDLWQIPEQVFSIRNDYRLHLRHYTEGVCETVMFFIPV